MAATRPMTAFAATRPDSGAHARTRVPDSGRSAGPAPTNGPHLPQGDQISPTGAGGGGVPPGVLDSLGIPEGGPARFQAPPESGMARGRADQPAFSPD
jgi:hypothetical protein